MLQKSDLSYFDYELLQYIADELIYLWKQLMQLMI